MNSPLQPEDYAVYQALLLNKFRLPNRERFVVRENIAAWSLKLKAVETIRSQMLYCRLKLPGLGEAAADDFVSKNAEPAFLEPRLELPLPYTLLSEPEHLEIWRRPDKQSMRGQPLDGWKIFHQRYPGAGGVIGFSRIGFNKPASQALVEAGVQSDWLMGHGRMFLLSLSEAGWQVSNEVRLWVS